MQQSSKHPFTGIPCRHLVALVASVIALATTACTDPGKTSADAARKHVAFLVDATVTDVQEVRAGLPEGAKQLASLWSTPKVADATEPAPAAIEAPAGLGSGAPTGSAAAPGVVAPSAAAGAGAPPTAAISGAPPPAEPPTAASAHAPAGSASPAGSARAPAQSDGASVASGPPSTGLGRGAAGGAIAPDAAAARAALFKARNKVQDLRVAKSTFFALTDGLGVVIRNDQDQDLMVGKALFESFPDLRQVLTGRYVETTGSMSEAAGIGNRPDAQWIAAAPVLSAGQVRGLYVTGWSWSAYAKRLENALRGNVLEGLPAGRNAPLVYVVIAVGKAVYGWETPDVNLDAVTALDPLGKLSAEGTFSEAIDLTGRRWGIAAQLAPALGKGVAVVVLRSET